MEQFNVNLPRRGVVDVIDYVKFQLEFLVWQVFKSKKNQLLNGQNQVSGVLFNFLVNDSLRAVHKWRHFTTHLSNKVIYKCSFNNLNFFTGLDKY